MCLPYRQVSPIETREETYPKMPAAYSPIVRNGRNERQVIQSFGGFSHFTDTSSERQLRPIVEVESDEDLEALPLYQDAGDRVYVDFPVAHQERATKLTEGVNETLSHYGSREEFFRANSDKIEFPVVSGTPDSPVEYGIHISVHRGIEDDFDGVAHRLMVRSLKTGLSEDQKATLRDLAETTRPSSDVMMFDVVDTELGVESKVEDDIRFLSGLFSEYETVVLNWFDPLQGQTENLTPSIAERYDCDSFGDYAIDHRFPPDGGGRPKSVKLRHYHPQWREVAVFRGEDYADAGKDLLDWEEWDRDHCNDCRKIASLVEQGEGSDFNQWKRLRMGHYIRSVIQEGS